MNNIADRIFSIKDNEEFNQLSLEIFEIQRRENIVYNEFLKNIGFDKKNVQSISDIPFLPIEFFKTKKVVTGNFREEKIFLSSGTSGNQSKHYVKDLEIYHRSFILGFENLYGKIEDYTILALLPSYLEREGSSLIYMIEKFINISKDKRSDFFLYDFKKLKNLLIDLNIEKKKTVLFGVSFALIDFLDRNEIELDNNFIVMETGGMKGRKKEIIREELHEILRKGFKTNRINSEYGMTELLSQAYLLENVNFVGNNWFRILIRDLSDPFNIFKNEGKMGGINVIDLANIYSCSFISTQDIGCIRSDNSFNVFGRIDNSDIRGCSLMLTEL